ncbi:MAG: hypothetical protein RR821_07625 [Clostridia bacterium]
MKCKKELATTSWGSGFHVDVNGNLHDVFPILHQEREPKEQKSKHTHRIWHVRPKLTTA